MKISSYSNELTIFVSIIMKSGTNETTHFTDVMQIALLSPMQKKPYRTWIYSMWMSDRVSIITLESLLEFEEFIIFYTRTFLLDFFYIFFEMKFQWFEQKKFTWGFFSLGSLSSFDFPHFPSSTRNDKSQMKLRSEHLHLSGHRIHTHGVCFN